MKKLFSLSPLLLVLLGASFYFFSCSKSSDPGPQVLLPKLDGFYIYGTNTIAEGPTDQEARMNLAILDHSQGAKIDNLAGVYGKLLYIGANSTINFAQVTNSKGTTYGADNGGATDSASTMGNVPIKDVVIHGVLKASGKAIKVADEGLYYAFAKANSDTIKFILMKVRGNLIGDITGWAYSISLPLKSTSKDSTVFEGTGVSMKSTFGYRYRFNNGWQVYADPNIVTLSSLGVADYGVAWSTGVNDIGYFNPNIPQKEDGVFTIRLSYNASTGGWKEKKTRTGDLAIDYSSTSMGLEGNAYVYAPSDTGAWAGNGTDGYGLKVPSKVGKVYTWTWTNVNLIKDREFIFLQNATWGAGLQIDYSWATVGGNAITGGKIVDATAAPYSEQYHNFRIVTGGAYDITFVIDESGVSTTKTITINTH